MAYKIMIDAGHGGSDMRKKKPVPYTAERIFLAKISSEELLLRIINTHRNQRSS